ncbi:MAG: hypothetical protein ACSLEL_01875 [Candidatus Malihini olakiniferum]
MDKFPRYFLHEYLDTHGFADVTIITLDYYFKAISLNPVNLWVTWVNAFIVRTAGKKLPSFLNTVHMAWGLMVLSKSCQTTKYDRYKTDHCRIGKAKFSSANSDSLGVADSLALNLVPLLLARFRQLYSLK